MSALLALHYFNMDVDKKQEEENIFRNELNQFLQLKEQKQDKIREELRKNKNTKSFTKRVMRPYNTKRRLEHKQTNLDRFRFKRQRFSM